MLKNLQKWTFFSYTNSYELPNPDPAKKVRNRISNTARTNGKTLG
jgi:hypothetical protein